MLEAARQDLDAKYFDPTFHGLDMNARFREGQTRIQNSKSYPEAIVTVEWVLDGLNDSQTFLEPPATPIRADYGFQFQFFGNECYVTEVKRGSDAGQQGLLVGDRLLAIDGQRLIRNQFFQFERYLEIAPRSKLRLDVLSPNSQTARNMTVQAKISQVPVLMDSDSTANSGFNVSWSIRAMEGMELDIKPASAEVGDVLVWRQPSFLPYKDIHVIGLDAPAPPLGEQSDGLLDRARKHRVLVLDLRGNLGGSLAGEQWLLGGVFDHNVHIYDVLARGQSRSQSAQTLGKRAFTGTLIVLVDSNSSAEAETFARVVQIEKRGYVIGDRTAGRMREAEEIHHQEFVVGTTPHYFVSVSTGNIIMTDGQNLEGVGVTPDQLLVPTPADLSAGRDPILAAALGMAGHPMDAEQAGKLLPLRTKSGQGSLPGSQ